MDQNIGQNGKDGEGIEKLIKDYQILEDQIRAYTIQLQELQIQKNEADFAKKEVEKASGKVYITIGGVIVETTKEKALENLKEKSEDLELKIQMVNKQLSNLKSKEESIKKELSNFK